MIKSFNWGFMIARLAMLFVGLVSAESAFGQEPQQFQFEDAATGVVISREKVFFDTVACSGAQEFFPAPTFCLNVYGDGEAFKTRSRAGALNRAELDAEGSVRLLIGGSGEAPELNAKDLPVFVSLLQDFFIEDRKKLLGIPLCEDATFGPEPILTLHSRTAGATFAGNNAFEYLQVCRQSSLFKGFGDGRSDAIRNALAGLSEVEFNEVVAPLIGLAPGRIEMVAVRNPDGAADIGILVFLSEDWAQQCDTTKSGLPETFLAVSTLCSKYRTGGSGKSATTTGNETDTGGQTGETESGALPVEPYVTSVGLSVQTADTALPVASGSWSANLIVGKDYHYCVYGVRGPNNGTPYPEAGRPSALIMGETLGKSSLGEVPFCPDGQPVEIAMVRNGEQFSDPNILMAFSSAANSDANPFLAQGSLPLVRLMGLYGVDLDGKFVPVDRVSFSYLAAEIFSSELPDGDKGRIQFEIPETHIALGKLQFGPKSPSDAEAMKSWCALDVELIEGGNAEKFTLSTKPPKKIYNIYKVEPNNSAADEPTEQRILIGRPDEVALRLIPIDPSNCDFERELTFRELQGDSVVIFGLPAKQYRTLSVFIASREQLARYIQDRPNPGKDFARSLLEIVNSLGREGARTWEDVKVITLVGGQAEDLGTGQTGSRFLEQTEDEIVDRLIAVEASSQLKNEVRMIETLGLATPNSTSLMIGFGSAEESLCSSNEIRSLRDLGNKWKTQKVLIFLVNVNERASDNAPEFQECGRVEGLSEFRVFEGPINALTSAQESERNIRDVVDKVMQSAKP